MSSTPTVRGAHLVGSVPLESAEAVFRAIATDLGPWLRRLADGETGERSNWIGWQAARFQDPLFEEVPAEAGAYIRRPKYRPRFEALTDYRQLQPLGYAAAALSSYTVFTRLRQAGVIASDVRFLVCLPTPLAPVVAHITPDAQRRFEPLYEQQLLEELRQILDSIPHADLAIQWDTAMEFAILEGVMPSFLTESADAHQQITTRLVRLGEAVPQPVELGYHLCYGDANHMHFTEPTDTRALVSVANAIVSGLRRQPTWLHLPVPRDRVDSAYFEPLRDLQLPPEAELYMGVVHLTDGLPGTRQRIDAAGRVLAAFGVATECGFGRRPPGSVPDLLRIHARVAEPVRRLPAH
jgi:hypothetical protein